MSEDQNDGSTGTPEWRIPADEQLKADAYHVWKPRPLLRSIHWKPVPEPVGLRTITTPRRSSGSIS